MRFICIADHMIPLLAYYFAEFLDIQALPADQMDADVLQQADILLVRSKTRVNETLLAKTQVQFIGSCTAGVDHLDLAYLKQQAMPFVVSRGCNASAVCHYVQQIIAIAQAKQRLTAKGRVAVIGCGHVGSQVAVWLNEQGWEVLCYDPPRAERDAGFQSADWQAIHAVDLICVHSEWIQQGDQCNTQMINDAFLARQKDGCVLINAARGGLIDEVALFKHSKRLTVCLDVWQDESQLPEALVRQVFLLTPHIAGNTVFGRANGTAQVYAAMAQHFGWPDKAMPTQYHDDSHPDLWQLSEQSKKSQDIVALRLKYLAALPI